jgi:acyl-CoA-binding protein
MFLLEEHDCHRVVCLEVVERADWEKWPGVRGLSDPHAQGG